MTSGSRFTKNSTPISLNTSSYAISGRQFKNLLKNLLGGISSYALLPPSEVLRRYQSFNYTFSQAVKDFHGFSKDTPHCIQFTSMKIKLEGQMCNRPDTKLTLHLYNYPRVLRPQVFHRFRHLLDANDFPRHITEMGCSNMVTINRPYHLSQRRARHPESSYPYGTRYWEVRRPGNPLPDCSQEVQSILAGPPRVGYDKRRKTSNSNQVGPIVTHKKSTTKRKANYAPSVVTTESKFGRSQDTTQKKPWFWKPTSSSIHLK